MDSWKHKEIGNLKADEKKKKGKTVGIYQFTPKTKKQNGG